MAPFAWQSNKAVYFYLLHPKLCLPDLIWHESTEPKFYQHSLKGVRKGGLQARTLFSLKLKQRAQPPASLWGRRSSGGHALRGTLELVTLDPGWSLRGPLPACPGTRFCPLSPQPRLGEQVVLRPRGRRRAEPR